jgi:cell division inhibitor SulA
VTSPYKIQPQSVPTKAFGVTELVLTSESPEQLHLLLPMLAYLSHNSGDRWITWISPKHLNRDLLAAYGVNTQCIRLIHCQDENPLWLIWEALASGTSNTVIASPGRLNEKELMQLEVAATKGECQGLLLRARH